MNHDQASSRLAALLRTLTPKTKQPASVRVLNTWIDQSASRLGRDAAAGSLSWLVASSVATAAVQRALDEEERQLFLLKGGTLLQHRLNATARTTKDVDGLIRGDMDTFFDVLEDVLRDPWGSLTLRRGEVEVIDVPTKIIRPRRFDIILELRGVTWRRVQFEVSADEGGIGADQDFIEAPPLSVFGLPDPAALVGITMRFQIAQKLHAVSDPHEPPDLINDRVRDVVDLLLLRDLIVKTGDPTLAEVRDAALSLFSARALEATRLGFEPRTWPPTIHSYEHWRDDYVRAAESGGVQLSLSDAIVTLNSWIAEISRA